MNKILIQVFACQKLKTVIYQFACMVGRRLYQIEFGGGVPLSGVVSEVAPSPSTKVAFSGALLGMVALVVAFSSSLVA